MPTPIARGLIAAASERPVDSPHASDIADAAARRRLIAFSLFGIAAYVAFLIATMPASVLVSRGPWRTGAGGTVWNGEVGLAGGSKLEWEWAPLRSLVNLAFAADWRVTGGGNTLGGRVLVGPSTTTVDSMTGTADAGLLQAIQPDLPFTCELGMQADFPRVRIGGTAQMIAGNLTTDAGQCTAKGASATPIAVPPLVLIAEHLGAESRLRLVPATQRRRTLMTIVLTEAGAVTVGMTAEGAAALPFVGMPAGATIAGQI